MSAAQGPSNLVRVMPPITFAGCTLQTDPQGQAYVRILMVDAEGGILSVRVDDPSVLRILTSTGQQAAARLVLARKPPEAL